MSNQEVEVIEDAEVVQEDEDLFGPEREAVMASLADDERIIEAGLSTFADVGWALMRIRDGKKYRLASPADGGDGYKTFEDYCARRWDISKSYGHRLMAAANVNAVLSPMGDIPSPERERQIRELYPLVDDPDALQAAWKGAVEIADGAQPTAQQVREVVNQYRQDGGYPTF